MWPGCCTVLCCKLRHLLEWLILLELVTIQCFNQEEINSPRDNIDPSNTVSELSDLCPASLQSHTKKGVKAA